MEESLKTIVKLLEKEQEYSIVLSGNKSDFTTTLYPPLQFKGKKWSVGLISLDSYYSFPNITPLNNIFKYSVDSGISWKFITLAVGSYEITNINSEIQRLMLLNGDTGISILVNEATLGSIVNIVPTTYRVNFTVNHSIANTLGFNSVVLTTGYNISPNIVNILTVNSVIVNCSIVGNSYLNGSNFPVIYSFFPNVAPGRKIVVEPSNIVYLPITTGYIPSIRIWITDQDNNLLDLRGDTFTCRLHFKEL